MSHFSKTFHLQFNDFYFRLAHEAIHKAHKGHESMHAQMLLILMVTVLVAQIVLVEWRKRHFRSYQSCTLIAMWVIPLVLSLR